MQEKITRKELLRYHDDSIIKFLDFLEQTNKITNGVWNKLYALLAIARKQSGCNYTMYQGYTSVFHVIDRTVNPVSFEYGTSLEELLK
jgi:hypothetical protein